MIKDIIKEHASCVIGIFIPVIPLYSIGFSVGNIIVGVIFAIVLFIPVNYICDKSDKDLLTPILCIFLVISIICIIILIYFDVGLDM